jgi:hypothetical protein
VYATLAQKNKVRGVGAKFRRVCVGRGRVWAGVWVSVWGEGEKRDVGGHRKRGKRW